MIRILRHLGIAILLILSTPIYCFQINFVEKSPSGVYSPIVYSFAPPYNPGYPTCNPIQLSGLGHQISDIVIQGVAIENSNPFDPLVEPPRLPFALAFYGSSNSWPTGCGDTNLVMVIRYDMAAIHLQHIVNSQIGHLDYWREVAEDVDDHVYNLVENLGIRPGDVGYKDGINDWEIEEGGVGLFYRNSLQGDIEEEDNEDNDSMVSATEEEIRTDWRDVMEGNPQRHSDRNWRRYGFDPDDLGVHPWPLEDPSQAESDEHYVWRDGNEAGGESGVDEWTTIGTESLVPNSESMSDVSLALQQVPVLGRFLSQITEETSRSDSQSYSRLKN
ncbi:hypothetical protein ABW20_dc0107983 [Dactylellina cionopaga]|nr:hypothetical protein ABW20_dc0107983 [Dactylellina cionopaga]